MGDPPAKGGWYTVFKDLVAGSIGGGAGIIVGQPMDVIKVRLMAASGAPAPAAASTASPSAPAAPVQYKGTWDCAVRTLRHEGLGGFYKGLGPPIVSVGAYQAVCFASFGVCLRAVTEATEAEASLPALFLAGCGSGAATVVVTTPSDLIKIKLQLQTGAAAAEASSAGAAGSSGAARQYKGMLDCGAHVLRTQGVRALYTGGVATLCRDLQSTGIYFASYHWTKRRLAAHWGGGDGGGHSVAAELLAGGLAGSAAWGSIVPFDVVKTRLQMQVDHPVKRYRGVAHCFRTVVREEGWRVLFRGTVPLLLRAFPTNAATFFVYEELLRRWDAWEEA